MARTASPAFGDTLSGTVVARPSGRSEAATRRNADRLEGYVVELGEQRAEVGENGRFVATRGVVGKGVGGFGISSSLAVPGELGGTVAQAQSSPMRSWIPRRSLTPTVSVASFQSIIAGSIPRLAMSGAWNHPLARSRASYTGTSKIPRVRIRGATSPVQGTSAGNTWTRRTWSGFPGVTCSST